jgi:MoaA/NifB/PqqE/SkfB family radical SAM enzyme
MVSFINSVGSTRFADSFPVLIINGEADELVPHADTDGWKGVFPGSIRFVKIPEGKHHLFGENNDILALDVIMRSIADVAREQMDDDSVDRIIEIEPEIGEFLIQNPLARTHLSRSPGGRRVVGIKPVLSPVVDNDPVFANIEITTRCNLQCRYCARSVIKKQGEDMSRDVFARILDMLPHAYRITLVGLGEPLMHPDVVDFVAYASSIRRRVALVTNAMLLDRRMSTNLIQAGLDSIAFSIDTPNQELANAVRKGSDFNLVVQNIKGFVDVAKENPQLSKAVFSAMSMENIDYLKDIIDVVADLGVNVLMLSDLNFVQNTGQSLCRNISEELEDRIREAIAYAFSKNLPVLSVRAIEEFGLTERYKDFLMLPPSQLYMRSESHIWCMSPWQTVPVNVCGNVSVCDCQPENIVGNLLQESFSDIWNGEKMVVYRRQMLSQYPPKSCSLCPRF